MTGFLSSQLDYIYFFYGLAFIMMAQTCLGVVKADRRLPWKWLGLFALLQGLHEWLELAANSLGDGGALAVALSVTLILSFMLLVEFGRATMQATGRGPGRLIFLPLLALVALGGFYGLPGIKTAARYVLGFGGGLWAAWSLRRASREMDHAGRRWLISVGAAIGLFAVVDGLIVRPAPFFPADTINSAVFFEVFHLPVQLVRGVTAVWALLSIITYSRSVCRKKAEDEVRDAKPGNSYAPLIAILTILVLGWFLTEEVGRYVERKARLSMLYRAKTAAAAINPERVKRLTGTPADLGTPDYERLRVQLKDVQAASPDCWSVYLEQTVENRIVFVVSTQPDSIQCYKDTCSFNEDASGPDAKVYSKGVAAVYGTFHDDCCAWYIAVAPVLDPSTGRLVAELRMDIHAAEWMRLVSLARLFCIVITLLFCLSVMAFFVARHRSRESIARGAALEVAAIGLANEKKLRDITSVLGEGVFVLDTAGRITFMNPEAERLLGWTEEELYGKDMHVTVHAILVDGATRLLEDCPICMTLADGAPRRISDDLFVRKDGTSFPVDYVATPLMDGDDITGVVTAFQDITERKEAGDLLKKSERRFAEAEVIAHFGSWEWVIKNDEVYWSDGLCRIFGVGSGEFGGKYRSYLDFVHPDDTLYVMKQVSASVEGKQPLEYVARIIRTDGAERIIHAYGRVSLDAEGKVTGLLGTVQDITEQRLAEDALKASEERYRALFNSGNDAVFVHRPTQEGMPDRFMEVNEVACRLLGFSTEELLELSPMDIVAPESLSSIGPVMERLIAEGRVLFEQELITKDGMRVPFELNASLFHFKGQPIILTVARDVTERKQAEKRLRLLSAAVEDAQDGIQIVDPDGRIVYANKANEDIYGFSPDELKGMHVGSLNADPEFAEKFIIPAIIAEGRWAGELLVKHKDESAFPIWLSTALVNDDKGNPIAMVGIIRDITERKRAEEALKESEAKFRSLVERSLVGVYIIQDWRFVYVNPRLSEMLGYPQEYLTGESRMLDFVYTEDRKVVEENVRRRMSGEVENAHYQVRWTGGDGHVVDTELFGSSITLGGRPAVIGTMLDITERKKLERQRADFYAMVTHDLKSPLTAVMGYTDIILEDKTAGMNGDTVEMVNSIKKSSRKLLHLVDDFLTISRMEAGIITLNESLVDVNELVAEAGVEAAALAQGKGLSFRLEVSKGQSWAVLDRTHVLRAVSNLIQNAVNYTPSGGSVTLKAGRVREGGEAVVISVSDDGPGIPAEEQGRVFEKYYRMARTAGIKGSGLGLAIVKTVAEAHKGRVELVSAEGKGCTFRLVFPA